MSEQQTANAKLSPAARALLAEMNRAPSAANADRPTVEATAADLRPTKLADPVVAEVPVFLAPHIDPKAKAFAEMLGHIDDDAGAALVDEEAALKAAEKYRAEKRAAHIDFDDDDTMADMGAEKPPPLPQPISDAEEDEEEQAGEISAALEAPNDDTVDFDDVLDDDLFGDEAFDIDVEEGGIKGFLARLRGSAGDVKKLIGVKNASAAYDAQSGASLLPFTIIRAVILLLVAAVPPAVNLIVIQPQISDNSRKLTQIRSFEAQAVESRNAADKLARKLAALEQDARRRIDILMPNSQLEALFNRYTSALQQYDIGLQRYNVSSLEERNVVVGSRVQQASLVEFNLEGRYDVYVDIRKIFVEQLKNVIVLNEVMVPQEDGATLSIDARLMVPTRRSYDDELDNPEKIAARKAAAEKKRQEEEARKAAEAAEAAEEQNKEAEQ